MTRVDGVSFSFPWRPAQDGLSIGVEETRTTAVVGRSGIGKSVLLRCVTGLLRPQSGSITIDGEEVVGAGRGGLLGIRAKIGMLFQEGALFDSMDLSENISFPLAWCSPTSSCGYAGFRARDAPGAVGGDEEEGRHRPGHDP